MKAVLVPLGRRDALAAAGLALLVLALGSVRLVPGVCGLFHDDGVYVSTAKALAEGRGYRLINLPGEPVQTKYPILYPALLALIWKLWPVFPDNLLALQVTSLLAGAAAVALSYVYLVRFGYSSRSLAAAAGLICATTSEFLYFGTQTLSEMPFALLLIGALWALENQLQGPPVSRWHQLILGLWLGLPLLCRSVGAALVPAGLFLLLRARRPIRWTLTGTVLMATPWLAWMLTNGGSWQRNPIEGYYTDYLGWWSGTGTAVAMGRVVLLNGFDLISGAAALGLHGLKQVLRLDGLGSLWGGMMFLVGLSGWLMLLVQLRQGRVLATCLAAYSLVVCFWPWPSVRFLVPIMPLLWAYMLIGLSGLARYRLVGLIAWGGLAAALLANLGLLLQVGRFNRQAGLDLLAPAPVAWASYQEVFAWLRTHSGPDDVVASGFDPMIYLYTGRQGFRPFVHRPLVMFYEQPGQAVGQAADLKRILQAQQARYLVSFPMPFAGEEEPFIAVVAELRSQRDSGLRLVYQGEDARFMIFEVLSKKEPAAD